MHRFRSVAPMIIAKYGYILMSALMCVLGLVLIAVPDFSIKVLGWVCGGILVVFGVVRLVGYFSKDLYRLAFQYDLALGIITAAIGVLILVNPGSLMWLICVTLGLSILADSIFKVQIALDSKKFGIKEWWVILLFAALSAVFGLTIMFRPGESGRLLMVFLGISILLDGFLNICTAVTAVKIVKNQRPDHIDGDYKEIE